MSTVAEVWLWGTRIGAAALERPGEAATFEYEPAFLASGVEVAPFAMSLGPGVHRFPELVRTSFRGLPGLISDSLPDRFGHAVIDAWLRGQGRSPEDFDALERLCYVGTRGMGALEFVPALGPRSSRAERIHLGALVELASEVLARREDLSASFDGESRADALREILRVGTSAGGARAKAVIAWNPETGEVRSGQAGAPPGFQHWLLKFDGVSGNRDKERLADPRGYGTIEYAYSLMAAAAGIHMTETRLLEEGGRRHFMTRRFDRSPEGDKLHMQSLGALRHLDLDDPRASSYEDAFDTIRGLGLGMDAVEEQFRRMAFNVAARNQDDHVKNIAFLMDRAGTWSLAPAFDVIYAYNPDGTWTAHHQMSIAGRREEITREDLRACARTASMRRGRADDLIDDVVAAVARWREFADEAGVDEEHVERIARAHRAL